VQDKIHVTIANDNDLVNASLAGFGDYIQAETQALSLELSAKPEGAVMLDMDDFEIAVLVKKA
jgi:isoleucyl-tRNA synthetase